jgi:hypothetical protein
LEKESQLFQITEEGLRSSFQGWTMEEDSPLVIDMSRPSTSSGKRTSDELGFIKPKKTARAVTNFSPSPIQTSNRMAPLANLPTDNILNSKQKSPPPIFVDKIANEANSCEIRQLLHKFKISATFRKHSEKQYIFYPTDEFASRTLQTKLSQLNTPYYTYAPRNTKRQNQYLILGLDINYPTISEIDSALQDVPDIISIRHMTKTDATGTKHPIPPVVVTTSPNTTLSHFENVKDICYYKVRVVKYNPKHEITQCTNCQEFGHSKGYCRRQAVCVRCAGPHSIAECDRNKQAVLCSSCGGDHVASFRLCPTRQKLLQQKHSKNTTKHIPPPTQTSTYPSPDDFPTLPKATKNIPGFAKQTPPTLPKFPTSTTSPLGGLSEILSRLFQQLSSTIIQQLENMFKSLLTNLFTR